MGWIIFGSIMLIFLIILFSPVKVFVEYIDGKPKIWLKYLFVKKYLVGGKKKAKPKKEKKKKPEKKKKEKDKEEKKGGIIPSDVGGKIDFFKELLQIGGRALRRFTKAIKISKIFIDFTISDEDAYECAIKFGKTNIIVYNAFTYMGYFLRLRKKKISIRCVYNQPKSVYNVSCKISLVPFFALAIGIAFIASFLAMIIKNKKNNKKKAAAEEKEEQKQAA